MTRRLIPILIAALLLGAAPKADAKFGTLTGTQITRRFTAAQTVRHQSYLRYVRDWLTLYFRLGLNPAGTLTKHRKQKVGRR